MRERKPWFYKGCCVLPADRNASGIRWSCRCFGARLIADTKAGMRQLITRYLEL